MSVEHHPAITRTTDAAAPALEEDPGRGPLGSGLAVHPGARRALAAPQVPDEKDEEVTISTG